jgi:PAS domain S-box-containing protein
MNLATPQKLKGLFPVLAGAVLLVLAAVSAFVAYNLEQSERRYYAEAEHTSRNLAMSLENALWAHFHEVDLALHRAQREFSQMHAEQRYTPEHFSSYLRSLKERMPQARSVRGSDANGMVVYGEDIDLSQPQDIKIREFFQRATTERGLVFGVPVKSRISGEMVFPLMLALTYPDGRFGGTAYVNMNNARINELIASLKLGPHGVITLIDTRQRLLHRYPANEGVALGTPLSVAPKTASILASGAQNASYLATSALDGEKRSYRIERIGAYPIYILVGLSERDFLAPWHGEVRNAVAFLAVLFLLTAALLAGVRMSLQRQGLALRALTESEARFRSLSQGLPQMVWTTVDARRFLHVSPYWRDFFGMQGSPTEPVAFEALVHQDDQARMRAAWAEARANQTPLRCDCRLRRRDGAWRVFDNHGLPQRDSSGAVLGWVGSSTDITEQVAARDALTQAKDQALAAGRAKSDFVANMSHEIRSPMNAVLGMLQLLQRTQLAPIQQDYAAKAETSARALLGILNDILDFSKVEEGKLALDLHPFCVDTLWRELAVILSANAGAKDIEVIFNVSPDLPHWLEGDDMRLRQVLLNLAGNAIKFTEQGEVVLTVTPLAMDDDAVRVAFSVRDTGIGISPEHLAHIFDGFSQAEVSTARRFGGTGLGLSISQRLVGLMGGTLCVTSTAGQGSEFGFTIALRRTAQQSAREESGRLPHLRCLIVDDNPTGRAVLAGMIDMFGWRSDAVASGEEALVAAAARHYDVIFMDWRMPGLDGWEASKRIRLLPPGQQAPLIVMVTAHDSALVTQTHGQFAPVLDAMLAKPLTASLLFDTVSKLRPSLGQRGTDLASMAVLAAACETTLAGLRLLVVDDNEMNQQVAGELLRAVGASVTVADSGRAAIDAVCGAAGVPGTEFDLVLMDIQMPDLDGYAATAEIHARLGAAAPPIVAMTANAMASDREAALAAGMVDHVGKPFDLEQLIGAILRQHPPAPAVACLDSAAAQARLGNPDVYLTVLRCFPLEMEKLTEQLSTHTGTAAAMHLLRGLAGMVGADRLVELAGAVEDRLHAGEAEAALAPDITLILAEMARASEAVSAHAAQLATP